MINAAAAFVIFSTIASTKIAARPPASQVLAEPAPVSAYCEADDTLLATMVSTDTADQQSGSQSPAKPLPMSGCYDSDGGDNPTVPGYVIDAVNTESHDECFNAGLLLEKVCGTGGFSTYVQHNCTCVSEWINVPVFGPRYIGKCAQ